MTEGHLASTGEWTVNAAPCVAPSSYTKRAPLSITIPENSLLIIGENAVNTVHTGTVNDQLERPHFYTLHSTVCIYTVYTPNSELLCRPPNIFHGPPMKRQTSRIRILSIIPLFLSRTPRHHSCVPLYSRSYDGGRIFFNPGAVKTQQETPPVRHVPNF